MFLSLLFHSLEKFLLLLLFLLPLSTADTWSLALAFVFLCRQAAIFCLAAASALTPMAQTKPRSSRPTAVTIFL